MVREWKEKYSFVGKPPQRVHRDGAGERRADGARHHERDASAACETIVPPMVETMLDLLSRVEPEFQERVRNNIILSGGGGLIRGLPQALEDALKQVGGGKVKYMEDPVFVGSDGGLALAIDAPDADWEKLSA